jgi:hypothetical protein
MVDDKVLDFLWSNLTKMKYNCSGMHYKNLHKYHIVYSEYDDIYNQVIEDTLWEFNWDPEDNIICTAYIGSVGIPGEGFKEDAELFLELRDGVIYYNQPLIESLNRPLGDCL